MNQPKLHLPSFVVTNIQPIFKNKDDLQDNTPVYVLYHDKCLDGATSALVVSELFGKIGQETYNYAYLEFFPVNYSYAPPEMKTPGHVFIVDFSYDPEVLSAIAKEHLSLTVIDHHKTAVEKILAANEASPLKFNYVLSYDNLRDPAIMGHSGGSLSAWVLPWILAPLVETPPVLSAALGKFVQLAREHDLWVHDGNTESDALALSYWFSGNWWRPEDTIIAIRATIDDDGIDAILVDGRNKLRMKLVTIKNSFLPLSKMMNVNGYHVPVCPCPRNLASLAATMLNKGHPFSVTFVYNRGKYEYSLRCDQHTSMDVSQTATFFGGGGHKSAAGWISESSPDELFKVIENHDTAN